jgi:hypothetical protein
LVCPGCTLAKRRKFRSNWCDAKRRRSFVAAATTVRRTKRLRRRNTRIRPSSTWSRRQTCCSVFPRNPKTKPRRRNWRRACWFILTAKANPSWSPSGDAPNQRKRWKEST